MRVLLAIQCFFKVLFSGKFADRVRQLMQAELAGFQPDSLPQQPAHPAAPKRSEAIALLATLQREARFVDIVSESLEGYADAQIGAAARDVLSDCGKVLQRLFALKPVVDTAEGESLNVPAGYDTGRYHLTGNISQEPPFAGQLTHAGWEATRCDLPAWTGSRESALVIAPAEVQIG